jgi:hypothetical protein
MFAVKRFKVQTPMEIYASAPPLVFNELSLRWIFLLRILSANICMNVPIFRDHLPACIFELLSRKTVDVFRFV